MKKLIGIVASALILLLVLLLLWEMVVVQREAPLIKPVVNEYLDARKARDAERMYAQMLPVEEGGRISREALEYPFTTWGQLLFERYKSVKVRVAWVIQGTARVRGRFSYDKCDNWFEISLVRTAKGWKIYDMFMPAIDPSDCIEEK